VSPVYLENKKNFSKNYIFCLTLLMKTGQLYLIGMSGYGEVAKPGIQFYYRERDSFRHSFVLFKLYMGFLYKGSLYFLGGQEDEKAMHLFMSFCH